MRRCEKVSTSCASVTSVIAAVLSRFLPLGRRRPGAPHAGCPRVARRRSRAGGKNMSAGACSVRPTARRRRRVLGGLTAALFTAASLGAAGGAAAAWAAAGVLAGAIVAYALLLAWVR